MSIETKPFTMNRLNRWTGDADVETFADKKEASRAAREEVMWESTGWVTVTDERTGEELFDSAGSFA